MAFENNLRHFTNKMGSRGNRICYRGGEIEFAIVEGKLKVVKTSIGIKVY